MTRTKHERGYALWIILVVCLLAIAGAKAWNDARKRQREELAALEQRRQTTATMDKERVAFEAKVAAERSKSEYDRAAGSLVAVRAKWADAVRVADATSRVALHGPVTNLQAIRREAEALLLPECLGYSRAKLVEGMQKQIDGFLAFMANELNLGEVLARSRMEEAAVLMRESNEAAGRCGPPT